MWLSYEDKNNLKALQQWVLPCVSAHVVFTAVKASEDQAINLVLLSGTTYILPVS